MPRLRSAALALLSGALAALCLPLPGFCALGWIALAPLAGLCFSRSPRRSALIGLLSGFAYHGVALYWIYSTCRFAHVPDASAPVLVQVLVSIFVWAFLAAFLALNWAAAAAGASWLCARARPAARPWAWALVWTAVAVASERWTPRLAIDLLAYTQWNFLSLVQLGATFGPHGLGFLVAFFNASVAAAWLSLREGRPSGEAAGNAAVACSLALGALVSGSWTLAARPAHPPSGRVEILQPNVDQYEKFDEAAVERIRGNFIELLSRPRPENPALIVWPESSLPYWINEGQAPVEAAPWSRKLGAHQIIGVVAKAGAEGYNAAFSIGPDGKFQGAYHKRELVPFGEFVPLRFLENYISILSQMGNLTAGEDRQPLLRTPFGPTAATICYEAMFPRLSNLDASRGARLIVNVTNDGWYKDTWGPRQHFEASVFRAVENRVDVIRSGNSGISAVIDPWGVVTARLDLGLRGRLDAAVPLDDAFPNRSFYARHGDWFGTLALWATAFWLGFAFWFKPRGA